MQSLTLLGDAVSSNPLFEKRRLKHINKFTSFTTSILPVVITYYCILFCKNINTVSLYTLEVGSVYAYLPLFYVLVYVFLNICEKFFANKLGGLFGQTQHINTSGIFILVFIPVTTAMISAGSVLELLLPLEFLGLVFYFIFLEFNFIGTASSDKQGNKAVMRGLMYYF